MDNITHSLMGAAIAEVVRPARSTSSRALFATVGIAAANFPDLDLLYSWITPAPLGYLLHHRGHTHTLGGVVVQIALLIALCYAVPAVRRMGPPDRRGLWTVIAVGLASHLILDAGNSYGVHPFYPMTSRWYYGDAVFIFEPWLWMLLAVPMAMTVSRRLVRVALVGIGAFLPLVLAFVGFVPWMAVVVLLGVGGLFAWRLPGSTPRRASAIGIGASAVLVVTLLTLSRVADRTARRLFDPSSGSTIVDVIRSADPGNPLCWSMIGVELREVDGAYVFRPATLSLAPGAVSPASCASHRVRGARTYETLAPQLIAYSAISQSLDMLRMLERRDCSVRAWLQFGRAPVIEGNEIFDQRFARGGDNFSAMPLSAPAQAAACPRNLTGWTPPRADLLRHTRD